MSQIWSVTDKPPYVGLPTDHDALFVATEFWGEVAGMLGKFGAGEAGCGVDAGDARSAALHLMAEALARLDSDSRIPAAIGAHLQMAIDALWAAASQDPPSIHIH